MLDPSSVFGALVLTANLEKKAGPDRVEIAFVHLYSTTHFVCFTTQFVPGEKDTRNGFAGLPSLSPIVVRGLHGTPVILKLFQLSSVRFARSSSRLVPCHTVQHFW